MMRGSSAREGLLGSPRRVGERFGEFTGFVVLLCAGVENKLHYLNMVDLNLLFVALRHFEFFAIFPFQS